VNSAALLLRSRSPEHPDGLANGSGQVGRNYMVHNSTFLRHPGGEAVPVPYRVHIVDPDHEVTAGLTDFSAASEQYYMHVDPTVHVLAETVFSGEHLPWLDGVRMPVAYVRTFGAGRVFYETIGHTPEDLADPDVTRLVAQACAGPPRPALTGTIPPPRRRRCRPPPRRRRCRGQPERLPRGWSNRSTTLAGAPK
jgi:choline dehydrogenase-like flavoprotein